jgi:hypothetical protein
MQAELKGLSPELAEAVGAHLMMAMQLIDDDPELAHRHAEAARRRASRLPLVREASAETAYAAGLYDEALAQYKTLRRMTGSPDVIPVMVDCLRAAGRYRDALELAREGMKEVVTPSMRLELIIVTAGVRVDMGERDEALRLLRREVESPSIRQPRLARARLLYAFADLLAQSGDRENAYRGFAQAARLDPDGTTTGALDRLDEFDGLVLDLDEDDLDDESGEPGEDDPGEEPGEDDRDDVVDDADEDTGPRETADGGEATVSGETGGRDADTAIVVGGADEIRGVGTDESHADPQDVAPAEEVGEPDEPDVVFAVVADGIEEIAPKADELAAEPGAEEAAA